MIDDDDEPPRTARAGRLAPSRRTVVSKLWKAAKRQLDAHEAHLAELPEGKAASESDAKALATLARTVRELVAIEGSTEGRGRDEETGAAAFRHVAELRRELGRRLEALAAAEAERPAAGTSAGPAARAG